MFVVSYPGGAPSSGDVVLSILGKYSVGVSGIVAVVINFIQLKNFVPLYKSMAYSAPSPWTKEHELVLLTPGVNEVK